jgi:hypothetical protein
MKRIRISAIFAAIILLVVASLGASLPALAQGAARSVAWQRYDVDLAIQSDGSVNVVETQAIQFTGTYQQGYRLVPLDRTTGAHDVSVAEVINGHFVPFARGSGQANTFSSSSGTDGLQIDWWFTPTTNTVRTFEVRYTVTGAVRIYDTGDQLQWRAIYADRDSAIASSSITVHLPSDVDAGALKSAWYEFPASGVIGALPAVADGKQIDPRTVQFALGQLPARQGAEVRVQFPHGAISGPPPPWQAQADRADWLVQTVAPIGDFVSLLLTIGVLAGGGVFLFFLWFSNGRDPAVGSVPRRLEEPPSSLPAPVAGTLVDERASEKDAVAALVDLADRGIVRLVDERNPQLVGSSSDVRITVEAPLDDTRLRSYERVLLAALFGHSAKAPAEVLLSNVKQQFQSSIPIIEARLSESVAKEGLFAQNPQTTRRRWQAIGVVVMVGGLALSLVAGILLGAAMHIAWLPGIALISIGGALLWIAGAMPRKTQMGALEAAKWRAFGRYLGEVSRAEKPGTALPPHFLPYAVALGVDQSFVRHLESVGTPPPTWFSSRGPGGVVFVPGGWYGGPWVGPRPRDGGLPQASGGVAAPPAPNPQGWSDALAAPLNAASEAMAHGGGSGGWSGGGFGGGGGGGGGSGGFR